MDNGVGDHWDEHKTDSDYRANRRVSFMPMVRITQGEHAGRVGFVWPAGGRAEVDLGPDGGFIDVPADWVRPLDGWDDGTVSDGPRA